MDVTHSLTHLVPHALIHHPKDIPIQPHPFSLPSFHPTSLPCFVYFFLHLYLHPMFSLPLPPTPTLLSSHTPRILFFTASNTCTFSLPCAKVFYLLCYIFPDKAGKDTPSCIHVLNLILILLSFLYILSFILMYFL